MVASEVSEKGLAWHEELKTDVVTDGEAPTWHLRDETSANESFGSFGRGMGCGVLLFFFLFLGGQGFVGDGVAKLTTKWSCFVSYHFLATDCFLFFPWGSD